MGISFRCKPFSITLLTYFLIFLFYLFFLFHDYFVCGDFMNIKILDTTLRDGEQTPGVSLTSLEKLRIATKLDEIGVNFIEAGSAITSEGERQSIKDITQQNFNAEILSFSRPLEMDIDYCLECDVDAVNLVVPTSDLHIFDKLLKRSYWQCPTLQLIIVRIMG